MSLNSSGISWTDGTMNSLYGCSACPDGCRRCYAVTSVHRHCMNPRQNKDGRYDGLTRVTKSVIKNGVEKPVKMAFTGRVLFDPKHLYQVLRDMDQKMIFVNEFSDLFHQALRLNLIIEHFRVFRDAQWHQFQALTKRGMRFAEIDAAVLKELGEWPSNLWMGTSVCKATSLDLQRIDQLGATHAKLKWISFEPWISDAKVPLRQSVPDLADRLKRKGIHWIVVGGESGPKSDTDLMTLDDARYLIQSGKAAGCRVHFKQLGTGLAIQLGVYATGEHRAKGGNPDQWPDDLNIREWPDFSWAPVVDVTGFTPKFEKEHWQHYDIKKNTKDTSSTGLAVAMTTA
jgi:protein gp37